MTKRLTAKQKEAERQDSIAQLLELLHPGDTVYTVLRHVSRSGMTRWIDLYVIRNDTPRYLSYHAATVLGWRWSDRGIVVSGCGMDMGFHTVYNLSADLFRDSLPPRHGYALNQRWI